MAWMASLWLIFLLSVFPLVAQVITDDEVEDFAELEDGTVIRYDESVATQIAYYELGNGLRFILNGGEHEFGLGAFIQPTASLVYGDLVDTVNSASAFTIDQARLFLTGKAMHGKGSFRLDMEFTDGFSLLEAWVGLHPWKFLNIYAGQMLIAANNRAYTFQENRLQFAERSVLSRRFTTSGRELGIFADASIPLGSAVLRPHVGVSSGDGRNSFGELSTDPDIGGVKLMGRLDVLPFGEFTENGQQFIADLEREESPKLVVGAAFSRNYEASGATGEGHGDFNVFNQFGELTYADYEQLFADLLVKYRGFSVLVEFANARIIGDEFLYLDASANQILNGENIADNYVVGQAYNVQAGYVFAHKIALDIRYSTIMPEFDVESSLLHQENWYTVALTKYFGENNGFRLSASGSYVQDNTLIGDKTGIFASILAQLSF